MEAFDQERVLVIEHRDQPLAAHIPVALAINRVTHRHVIRGDGLGDGAAGSADSEEPPRHFLTGTNLGEDAVLGRVEVDLQCFLVGIELVAHSLSRIENRISPERNLQETPRVFPLPLRSTDPWNDPAQPSGTANRTVSFQIIGSYMPKKSAKEPRTLGSPRTAFAAFTHHGQESQLKASVPETPQNGPF